MICGSVAGEVLASKQAIKILSTVGLQNQKRLNLKTTQTPDRSVTPKALATHSVKKRGKRKKAEQEGGRKKKVLFLISQSAVVAHLQKHLESEHDCRWGHKNYTLSLLYGATEAAHSRGHMEIHRKYKQINSRFNEEDFGWIWWGIRCVVSSATWCIQHTQFDWIVKKYFHIVQAMLWVVWRCFLVEISLGLLPGWFP